MQVGEVEIEPARRSVWNLTEAIDRIAHWLPVQGPLKDFVHHNTLHALQDHPFHEATAIAASVFGARDYLPLSWYQLEYRRERISPRGLRRALLAAGIPEDQHEVSLLNLLHPDSDESNSPGLVRSGVREAWREHHGFELDNRTHPILFRLLSAYVDQGIAIWKMPSADGTFWGAMRALVEDSSARITPLSDSFCRELLRGPSEHAIEVCLEILVGSPLLYESYLLEMTLAHPGWSGMVRRIEVIPDQLMNPRGIRLQEALALELLLEVGWAKRELGELTPADRFYRIAPPNPYNPPTPTELSRKQRIWQEALEWTYYDDVLGALESHKPQLPTTSTPTAQVYFCIDDREGSLRRHLEAVDPRVETFGVAGFFGIDFLFQHASTDHAVQHCPVVIRPKHVVREVIDEPGKSKPAGSVHFHPQSHTLLRGWLLSQTLGLTSALRLAANMFRPDSRLMAERNLTQVRTDSRLELLRESEDLTPEGHLRGYTVAEMVERVAGVLISTGLTSGFSKLLVFIAHGSSSANNPHFAAYNCGACSGRAGYPNARAFAWMANHPAVREGLRQRGITIPTETFFVGALHDTSRDEVTFFETEALPESRRGAFREFCSNMERALELNAKERTRRFELASPKLSPKRALAHVRDRASSIFEPRPELNHATNALCVIGPRSSTRGLFLDRRGFLNSYDPKQDPDGAILVGILGAAVPVCGGINLEYFFSRVDNKIYGAGTKLPHNVVALLGVANGVEGDLRTGLPLQMVELHDPVRLLIVVEQTPEITLRAAKQNPEIYQWIQNGWVRLASLSPGDRRTYIFERDRFISVFGAEVQRKPLPQVVDTLSLIQGRDQNIAAHELGSTR